MNQTKQIDAKTFWRALGARSTGVVVATARGPDGPAGFLALSATHVTADPPTMLVSIDKRTAALDAVLHGKHFALNFLPAGDRALADKRVARRHGACGRVTCSQATCSRAREAWLRSWRSCFDAFDRCRLPMPLHQLQAAPCCRHSSSRVPSS